MFDPYSILGVSRDASDEEIKRHTESSAGSIIRMQISITPIRTRRRKSLKRSSRPMIRS